MPLACIALGSNLGAREALLDAAMEQLASTPGVRVVARSGNFDTEPVGGPPGQGRYLNAAVLLDTTLPPRELMDRLKAIEAALGRPPEAERVPMGPRPIDMDLLLYGDRALREPGLTLPHPRMHLRRFVLEPLAEIAPTFRHPLLGATVAELLRWLGDDAGAR